MNLQPTQVYNWFANYRRRQKSFPAPVEQLSQSCPGRALTHHPKEGQGEGFYAPQAAGLSLSSELRMWFRKLRNNLKFHQEGKVAPSLATALCWQVKWTRRALPQGHLIGWVGAVTP